MRKSGSCETPYFKPFFTQIAWVIWISQLSGLLPFPAAGRLPNATKCCMAKPKTRVGKGGWKKIEAVQAEPDGRALTHRNMCYQWCLPSFIPWLVRFLAEYPVTGSKSMRKHNCYRVQALSFFTVRYISTSIALLQLMPLTFKPLYWCISITRVTIKNALHRISVFSYEIYLLAYAIYWCLLWPGQKRNRKECQG